MTVPLCPLIHDPTVSTLAEEAFWRRVERECEVKPIDENELARCVTCCIEDRNPGQVTIAQTKEVMKSLLDHLAARPASVVMELVERHRDSCCSLDH